LYIYQFTNGIKGPPPEIETPHGGDNQWDTRPTFGINHETRTESLVENGFSFNGESFTITDNHHTPFEQQSINIGTANTFAATVYASKGLMVQEFLFGVPGIGEGHEAEMRIEIWYEEIDGNTGDISDVKVISKTDVIDKSSLSVAHQKTKCLDSDTEEKCDITFISAIFLEPLKDQVMAIKAIDFEKRDQTTYLNEGFDILGKSLNPMVTSLIPPTEKYEGLILVTQTEKYSKYWVAEDGRMFERNDSGSFKLINQSFERFQDSGEPRTRLHSEFGGVLKYENERALNVFNGTTIISELPDSFSHYITISERITDELIQEMIIQEQIAKDLLKRKYLQARW
jgi:hypothetical protein